MAALGVAVNTPAVETRIRATRERLLIESLVESVGWLDAAIGSAGAQPEIDRLVGVRSQLVAMLRLHSRRERARDHAWSLRLTQLAEDIGAPPPPARTARKRTVAG